tara:strand:- start:172 stop:372 length:201 start_codon:yes stop_codon:yes gene_type:complete
MRLFSMSENGVQISVCGKSKQPMLTVCGQWLMNQNSCGLIGDSAVDVIPAAHDPPINNFGVNPIKL